jgi:hypothetical protein
MGHPRRTCILAYSKNAALTPKLYSHSSMHRAPYTRGSLHGNGQCAFLLSFWSLVYLPSGHLLGQLLFEKTRRRRRKPRVGLRDPLHCTTHRNIQSSIPPLISEAAQLGQLIPFLRHFNAYLPSVIHVLVSMTEWKDTHILTIKRPLGSPSCTLSCNRVKPALRKTIFQCKSDLDDVLRIKTHRPNEGD